MTKRFIIFLGILVFFIFVGIVFLAAMLKFDDRWLALNNNFVMVSWITLIIFRVLIYGLPGIIILNIGKFRNRNFSILNSYTIQFSTYTILKIVWDIFALEYLVGVNILNFIDTSIIVVSLLLTLILNKPTKVEVDLIPPHQE